MAFIHLFIQNIGDIEAKSINACTAILPLPPLPAKKNPVLGLLELLLFCSLLVPLLLHNMSNERKRGRRGGAVKKNECLQRSLRYIVEKEMGAMRR